MVDASLLPTSEEGCVEPERELFTSAGVVDNTASGCCVEGRGDGGSVMGVVVAVFGGGGTVGAAGAAHTQVKLPAKVGLSLQ
jgi:hypothetical protein